MMVQMKSQVEIDEGLSTYSRELGFRSWNKTWNREDESTASWRQTFGRI